MFLRLFPLQTVLFPGMRLPLHVFEERYKTMVRECMEEDAPFGVLLIRMGPEVGGSAVPHGVGTTARIAQAEYLDDGRINIFTLGERRFRITRLDTSRPYLSGDVDIIEQQPPSDDAWDLMPHAQSVFNDYFRTFLAIGDQWSRGVDLPRDPGEAADYIAARTDCDNDLKQAWLEQLSPAARLRSQLETMAAALPDLRARLEIRLRQKTAGFGVLN